MTLRIRYVRLIATISLVVVLGCSSVEQKDLSPRQVFDRMEGSLLRQDRVRFTVSSEGIFSSSFEGWISHEGGELAMVADGLWANDPVMVSAETSRDLLVLNTPTQVERIEREPFLATAVFVGISRMGVLHNLARLVAGKGPDRADGSVRQWVEARNIQFAGDGMRAIKFEIWVSGQKSGTATMQIDPETFLPTRRDQTVEFPSGTMNVVETYQY